MTDDAAQTETAGTQSLRAAVIGAGSMGTLIASVLGHAMPVVMVCRNQERAAGLFRWGARAEGLIEASSRPILVHGVDEIANAGGASLVVVATKTTAIPSVASDLSRVLGSLTNAPEGPLVVSFQNGIDPGRELMKRLSHRRVLRMVLSLGATLSEDGRCARVTLNQPKHAIGSIEPALRPECERLARVLSEGGLETSYAEDIETVVWRKAIVNAAVNPVAALVNCHIGEVLDSPSSVIMRRLVREGAGVARAEGIVLPEGYEERVVEILETAREHLPSMVEDIRGGRETEIGQLNRQIIEHGKRVGVATPTHDTIDALIETFDWKVYQG